MVWNRGAGEPSRGWEKLAATESGPDIPPLQLHKWQHTATSHVDKEVSDGFRKRGRVPEQTGPGIHSASWAGRLLKPSYVIISVWMIIISNKSLLN